MRLRSIFFIWLQAIFFFSALPAYASLQPPAISASSYILIDATTGDTLAENNADLKLPPASLTKMMTDYVISDALTNSSISLDDPVHISKKAWAMQGSKMFVMVDTDIAVKDLLNGMIIQSGNDATIALAEHVAGSEEAFTQRMNDTARSLGMTSSMFQNATGWPDPEHYSTARDLAILARAMVQNHPDQYKLYAEKEFTWSNIRQTNRNLLLWRDSTVDGVKTGHTEEAGFCLVASAKQGDMRLISVVMGTTSENARAVESQKLLTFGFRNFETKEIYSAGSVLETARVWKGNIDQLEIGVLNPIALTLERGQHQNLTVKVAVEKIIEAPITKGKALGVLTISLHDQVLINRPIVALQDIEQGSLFKQLLDSIKLFFAKLLNNI